MFIIPRKPFKEKQVKTLTGVQKLLESAYMHECPEDPQKHPHSHPPAADEGEQSGGEGNFLEEGESDQRTKWSMTKVNTNRILKSTGYLSVYCPCYFKHNIAVLILTRIFLMHLLWVLNFRFSTQCGGNMSLAS